MTPRTIIFPSQPYNLCEVDPDFAEEMQAAKEAGYETSLVEASDSLAIYENTKRGLNQCSRSNLDSSGGLLFCFVLPTFYPDGSHDPWGPKDVPWGRETS